MNPTLDGLRDGPTIPKSLYKAHCFLQAGTENREHMAYLAFKGRIPWLYSIPLESVVSYLRWRKRSECWRMSQTASNAPDIRLLLQSAPLDAPMQVAHIPTPQSVVHLHGLL